MDAPARLPPPSGVYRKNELPIEGALESFRQRRGDTGAVVTFIGTVKSLGANGKRVSSIEMEAYDPVASSAIQKICSEIKRKHGLTDIRIYHFVGSFKIGEVLVAIMVASKSRWEAYDALKEAVERYKSEPPIWKKEVYEDGSSEWLNH